MSSGIFYKGCRNEGQIIQNLRCSGWKHFMWYECFMFYARGLLCVFYHLYPTFLGRCQLSSASFNFPRLVSIFLLLPNINHGRLTSNAASNVQLISAMENITNFWAERCVWFNSRLSSYVKRYSCMFVVIANSVKVDLLLQSVTSIQFSIHM